MKILISVDIEGINGIDDYNQIKETNKKRYNHSCRLMTEETNTAIEACIEGGATKIFLVDGHGDGNNLIKKELNSKAITIKKKKLGMMEGINKDIDFCIFIGYHGMASVPNSFTAHTNSSKLISRVKINNKEVSEGHMNATVAKSVRAKTIFISGTDYGVKELKKNIKGIRSVITKKSINWNKAKSYNRKKVLSKIKKGIRDAIKNNNSINFINLPIKNIIFQVEVNYSFILENLSIKKINSKTIKIESKDILKSYTRYRELLNIMGKKYSQIYG